MRQRARRARPLPSAAAQRVDVQGVQSRSEFGSPTLKSTIARAAASTSQGRLPRNSIEQCADTKTLDHPIRVRHVDRRKTHSTITDYLHEQSSGADDDYRAHRGIAKDPESDLDTCRCVFGQQHLRTEPPGQVVVGTGDGFCGV